ncbi:MAG: response regulator [Deltaproteobacteria bacterium]|nr:response regulator [Deltaproteobacteria bacterium]
MTQYSINISGPEGSDNQNLLYKDRSITDRERLERIYEVSTFLMQSLDINEISEKIMDSLFYCLKRIDSGSILLVDDKQQLKEIIAKGRNTKKRTKMDYSRTIVNRVLRQGKAIMMSDTSRENEENLSDSIALKRIKSIMCVPLISKSKIRGAIYVHSVNVPTGFEKDDLYFLTGLSSPAAVAIENALLYSERRQAEKELRKARDELGYRVVSVTSGEAAVARYESWQPDVVLLDRNMPEMDGITCAELIMEHEPGAKIVLLSGYDEHGPDGSDDTTRAFIKGYLTKPIDMGELSLLLSRLLR